MRTRWVLTPLLIWFFPGIGNSQISCNVNFEPSKVDAEELSHAVFSIGFDGSGHYRPSGTGYLIDAQGLHILTAKHVLEDRTVGSLVAARSDTWPNEKYKLEIIALHATKDVALAKIVDGTVPQDTLAFDLRMKAPKSTESLHIWTYADLAGDTSRKGDNPTFSSIARTGEHAGSYNLRNATLKKASGSPVFDDYGRVIATLTDNSAFEHFGFALPSSHVSTLLTENIELSDAATILDKALKKSDTTVQDLVALLQVVPGNVTNLDFLLVLAEVIKNRSKYPDFSTYLECPIMYAMADRGLRLSADFTVQYLEIAAQYAFTNAHKFEIAGDVERASTYYDFAFYASARGADQIAARSTDWHSRVGCVDGLQGSLSEIRLPLSLASMQSTIRAGHVDICDSPENAANRLGRLLTDSALAKVNVGRLDGTLMLEESHDLDDAQRIAALAILVSDNESVLGDASALLGFTSFLKGDIEESQKALAAAYLNGETHQWILKSLDLEVKNLDKNSLAIMLDEIAVGVLGPKPRG